MKACSIAIDATDGKDGLKVEYDSSLFVVSMSKGP